MERTGKFYRKNEAEVMRDLGLKPTVNSGSGWVEKEDGQNDYLIAQLKSTDAQSIRIAQKDISILEYNASVAHKVPCFVIQFLNNNDVFIMARPTDIVEVAKYIETGKCEVNESITLGETLKKPKIKKIESSESSRESFWKEKEEENKKWKAKSKRKY